MLRMRLFLALTCCPMIPAIGRADLFDNYTNAVLAKVPEADGVKELPELSSEQILESEEAIPNMKGALLVVYTNDARWSKLLVSAAAQKFPPAAAGAEPEVVPMLRIDRFVIFRESSERAIKASGQNLSLFPGFHLHL